MGHINKFQEIVWSCILFKLDVVFNEELNDEVVKALNTDKLEHDFPMLVGKFWARIALPLLELKQDRPQPP